MAARVYDIYDLNSAFVEPTAPRAQTMTTPTAAAGANRLLRGLVYLLVFAGLLFLAAVVIKVTPLGAIDADVTMPFVAVVAAALVAIVAGAMRA